MARARGKTAPSSSTSTAATSGTALPAGVAACLAYAATLYPSVAGGDSGELVGAAATLGVPHPSGYPLYVLLTAPFTWLPWLSVAGRANLASAVFAAAAAALVCRAAALATGRRWAGVAAAGAFAFSPTVWLYATSAEVFALNNLLIAIQIALFAAVDRRPDARPVYGGALVLSLGAANHLTSVIFNGILFAAMVWRTRPVWRSPLACSTLAACLAAGLAPYVYLPLAAARHPLFAWGDAASSTRSRTCRSTSRCCMASSRASGRRRTWSSASGSGWDWRRFGGCRRADSRLPRWPSPEPRPRVTRARRTTATTSSCAITAPRWCRPLRATP
jgi:hypothetical protein